MKTFIQYILLLLPVAVLAQTPTQNKVTTQVPQVPVSDPNQVENLPIGDKHESVQYSDGFGRTKQSIAVGMAPDGSDVVEFKEYDQFGREPKQYLPFSKTGNNGMRISNPVTEQAAFYQNQPNVAHDTKPYSETVFENSPASRPLEQAGPGAAWQLVGLHSTQSDILLNTSAHPVRRWIVSGSSAYSPGNYTVNTLTGTYLKDEDGGQVYELKDKLDRVVYKKVFRSTYDWYETYWVYDDFGNVRFVIPPKAMKLMQQSNNFDLSQLTEDLVFQYRYDKRQRLIEKKIPGKDWEYTIYDNLDRAICTQDGKLRLNSQWQFIKYDRLGRPVVTGLFRNTSWTSRSAMQAYVDQALNSDWVMNYEGENSANPITHQGYSAQAFPGPQHAVSPADWVVHTVTHYDDYDLDNDGTADLNWALDAEYSDIHSDRVKGQVTHTKVRVLNRPGISVGVDWLTATTFYDDYGRAVHTQSLNHLGGTDLSFMEVDFAGKVIQSKSIHNVGMLNEVTIRNRFGYDHAGRLIEAKQQNNDDPEITLNQNVYNALGQLIEKNVGKKGGRGNFLQSVDYAYHIRGWLKRINDPDFPAEVPPGERFYLDQTEATMSESTAANGEKQMEMEVVSKILVVPDDQTPSHYETMTSKVVLATDSTDSVYQELKAIEGQTVTTEYAFPDLKSEAGLAYAKTETEEDVPEELDNLSMTNSTAKAAVVDGENDVLQQQAQDLDELDLFHYEIMYEEGFADLGADPLYSGNISGVKWRSKSDDVERGYGYRYDALKRLNVARFGAWSGADWTAELGHYDVTGITYDPNGNIKTLKRNGFLTAGGFGPMDGLVYTYDGNRLQSVTDNKGGASTNDFFDNGALTSMDYLYDVNGNLTQDANKGLTATYDHQNLPEKVDFGAGQEILFLYDGTGQKLRKVVKEAGQPDRVRDYASGFVYQDGALEFFATTEGRVVKDASSGNDFRYEYHFTDHLGNTRLAYADLDRDGVVEAGSEVLQEDHFYPYGMNLVGIGPALTGVEELRKFNGVELQKEFDLNWYATDFRMLDVQTGRWTQVDPLAEKFGDRSPYSGLGNNPVFYADALGLEPDSFNVNSPIMHYTSKSYNPPANSSNKASSTVSVGVYALGGIYDGGGGLIGFSAYNTERGTLDYTFGENELENFSKNADAYAGVAEGLDNLPYEGVKDYVNGLKTFDWGLAASGLGEQWANAVQDPDWWMQVGGGALGGTRFRSSKAAQGVANLIPEGKLANHLFKGANKLVDTPANRTLIQKVSNGKALGVDSYGKSWYAKTMDNGTQVYTYTRNGVVKGAGINQTPVDIIARYDLK